MDGNSFINNQPRVFLMYFTRDDSALILIDHQVEMMQLIHKRQAEQVKRYTLELAKMAKILGLPTVFTTIGEDLFRGPLIPGLDQILPEAVDARIKREGTISAWADSRFRQAVEATGRKNLIMAGVTTDTGLVFTSIEAVLSGFRVQAVMDASASASELSEEMARLRMRDAGVVLTSTHMLIAELAQSWNTPDGMELIGLLFQDILQVN